MFNKWNRDIISKPRPPLNLGNTLTRNHITSWGGLTNREWLPGENGARRALEWMGTLRRSVTFMSIEGDIKPLVPRDLV